MSLFGPHPRPPANAAGIAYYLDYAAIGWASYRLPPAGP
jgi:hypothetical protein